MKNLKFILLLVTILSITSSSCGSSHNQQLDDCVTIKLTSGDKVIEVSELIDVIDWIDLSSNDSVFVNEIRRIAVHNGEYYLLDIFKNNCVFRYDGEGRFLNRIGSVGNGAGEYINIIDFCVNNNKVVILTGMAEVYVYDKDGTFERKDKLDGEWYEIASADFGYVTSSDNISISSAEGNFLLGSFDNQFKPIDHWFHYPKGKQYSNALFANGLVAIDGSCYYTDNINHKIYKINSSDDLPEEIVRFDLNNAMPNDKYLDLMSFMNSQRDFNWINDIIILPDGFLLGYIYNGTYTLMQSDWNGQYESCYGLKGPFPTGIYTDGGQIVSPVTPDSYWNYWENIDDIKQPDFEVNEDTNVMLIIWKPKKHQHH